MASRAPSGTTLPLALSNLNWLWLNTSPIALAAAWASCTALCNPLRIAADTSGPICPARALPTWAPVLVACPVTPEKA